MKSSITFLGIFVLSGWAVAQEVDIYTRMDGNITLTAEYTERICKAAREKTNEESYYTELEVLISRAAGTFPGAVDQQEKVATWWKDFGINCKCEATADFPEGNFLRQALYSDFRLFINIIGPPNRLELDLDIPDPSDGLTLLEYVDRVRRDIEAGYNNDRRRFQRDEKYKSFIFFFMLLSEFSIK